MAGQERPRTDDGKQLVDRAYLKAQLEQFGKYLDKRLGEMLERPAIPAAPERVPGLRETGGKFGRALEVYLRGQVLEYHNTTIEPLKREIRKLKDDIEAIGVPGVVERQAELLRLHVKSMDDNMTFKRGVDETLRRYERELDRMSRELNEARLDLKRAASDVREPLSKMAGLEYKLQDLENAVDMLLVRAERSVAAQEKKLEKSD